ncbi:uncharacterized protein LOC144514867 [Sander vitreus]
MMNKCGPDLIRDGSPSSSSLFLLLVVVPCLSLLLPLLSVYCCHPLFKTGADGRCEELLETTWPSSDLTARPCLASAASELHFSPGSPEETPLNKMLFLPAAALCCLCSALAAMATQLIQEDLTLTRRVGGNVSFSCRGTEQCYNDYVFWYQKRDTETFTVILYIDKSNGDIEEPVVKPVVSVYPAASRAHLEGKSSLLCLSSAMFPPLVKFSWKRRNETGPLEELPPAEGEQLEIRELRHTASILLINQQVNSNYKYRCDVLHEGGKVVAQTEQGSEGLVTVFSTDYV